MGILVIRGQPTLRKKEEEGVLVQRGEASATPLCTESLYPLTYSSILMVQTPVRYATKGQGSQF
jgi:hypothetical protein